MVTLTFGMLTQESDLGPYSPLVSSPEHEVLMVSYCDQSMSVVRRASCVVINLFQKVSPPEPLGQCDSNFIGMLPRWLPTKIAKIVPLR